MRVGVDEAHAAPEGRHAARAPFRRCRRAHRCAFAASRWPPAVPARWIGTLFTVQRHRNGAGVAHDACQPEATPPRVPRSSTVSTTSVPLLSNRIRAGRDECEGRLPGRGRGANRGRWPRCRRAREPIPEVSRARPVVRRRAEPDEPRAVDAHRACGEGRKPRALGRDESATQRERARGGARAARTVTLRHAAVRRERCDVESRPVCVRVHRQRIDRAGERARAVIVPLAESSTVRIESGVVESPAAMFWSSGRNCSRNVASRPRCIVSRPVPCLASAPVTRTDPADVAMLTLSATTRDSVSEIRARDGSIVMPDTVPATCEASTCPRSTESESPARSTTTSASSFPAGTVLRPLSARGSTSRKPRRPADRRCPALVVR